MRVRTQRTMCVAESALHARGESGGTRVSRRLAAAAACCLLSVKGAAAWSFRTQTRDAFLDPEFNCPPGAADEADCHTRDFMIIQKHEISTASMLSFNGFSILASSFHSCPVSLVRRLRAWRTARCRAQCAALAAAACGADCTVTVAADCAHDLPLVHRRALTASIMSSTAPNGCAASWRWRRPSSASCTHSAVTTTSCLSTRFWT